MPGQVPSVSVTSAEEAKAAVKELRQRKRELKFLRGALAKRKKAARAKRPKKAKVLKSGLATFMDDMRWGLSAVLEQSKRPPPAAKNPTLAEIEAEMHVLDETIHNIDGCILQLEGKLLHRK